MNNPLKILCIAVVLTASIVVVIVIARKTTEKQPESSDVSAQQYVILNTSDTGTITSVAFPIYVIIEIQDSGYAASSIEIADPDGIANEDRIEEFSKGIFVSTAITKPGTITIQHPAMPDLTYTFITQVTSTLQQ